MRTDVPQRGSDLSAHGLTVAIVASRFNCGVTERLLTGAQQALQRMGARAEAVTVIRVPGAFEIPVAAQQLAAARQYDGILCLGCVIRGDTPHFEHICRTCADGIRQVALATGVPVIFGVLTVETLEQALMRAGGRLGNMGEQGAHTLVEMAHVIRQIRKPKTEIRNKRQSRRKTRALEARGKRRDSVISPP